MRMLAIAYIYPLSEIAHQAGGILLSWVEVLEQMLMLAQAVHPTINLTVNDPASQLCQNIIRDVGHRVLLGKRHFEAKASSYPIQTPSGTLCPTRRNCRE